MTTKLSSHPGSSSTSSEKKTISNKSNQILIFWQWTDLRQVIHAGDMCCIFRYRYQINTILQMAYHSIKMKYLLLCLCYYTLDNRYTLFCVQCSTFSWTFTTCGEKIPSYKKLMITCDTLIYSVFTKMDSSKRLAKLAYSNL